MMGRKVADAIASRMSLRMISEAMLLNAGEGLEQLGKVSEYWGCSILVGPLSIFYLGILFHLWTLQGKIPLESAQQVYSTYLF